MSETMAFKTSIASKDGGTVVSDSTTYSAAAIESVSDVAAAGALLEIDLVVDVSQIVAFYIESDQDLDCNLNINGTPALGSASLKAKKAYWWNTDRHDTNPLSVDITKIFFDNTDGALDANVKAGFLVDVDT